MEHICVKYFCVWSDMISVKGWQTFWRSKCLGLPSYQVLSQPWLEESASKSRFSCQVRSSSLLSFNSCTMWEKANPVLCRSSQPLDAFLYFVASQLGTEIDFVNICHESRKYWVVAVGGEGLLHKYSPPVLRNLKIIFIA